MIEGKPITIELYPHQVEIKLNGDTVATTEHALLLIETYAPDIYIPFDDIKMHCMIPTDKHTHCPYKGDASY